jgi:hypothetical protein
LITGDTLAVRVIIPNIACPNIYGRKMKNLKSLLLLAALTTYINSNCAAAKAGDILNFQFGGGSTSAYTNGAAINDNTQIWNRLRSTAVTTVDNRHWETLQLHFLLVILMQI